MAQDGKTQREAAERAPEPVPAEPLAVPAKLPLSGRNAADRPPPMPTGSGLGAIKPGNKSSGPGGTQGSRRAAKRRAAGPARAQVAANDDAPSIGGLIFALQQQPSNRPFQLAAGASGGWLAVGALLVWAVLAADVVPAGGSVFTSPMMVVAAATICLPIALFWFLALLAWRAQELKLMSSAMTEVAVRLAEPDRAAEQDRKSTRLNSSHSRASRMPSSA